MPPKVKFTKEDVVDAAFAIVCERGFAALTARAVAARLHASVAPIYANFANLEDLAAAVVERAYHLSGEILAGQSGEDVFTDIGRASLEMARTYPVLFRELVLNPTLHSSSYEEMEEKMVAAMADSPQLAGWSLPERRKLLLKMRVFHTGLAVMAATDGLPPWLSSQYADDLLFEAGADFVSRRADSREEKTK